MTNIQTTSAARVQRVVESCREIPVKLTAHSATDNVPITTGVCLPKGQLTEAGDWLTEGVGGTSGPVQTRVLNRWRDGSIRWLLTRFTARRLAAGETHCLLVRPDTRAQHAPSTMKITSEGDHLLVQVQTDIREPKQRSGFRICPQLTDTDGRSLQLKVNSVRVDEDGPISSVSVAELAVIEDGHTFLRLQMTVEAWPTTGLFNVSFRIRNSRRAHHRGGLWDLGDPGSFHFGGCFLRIEPADLNPQKTDRILWRSEIDAAARECSAAESIRILQRGSGGRAWANRNHRDKSGRSTVRSRGYRAEAPSGNLRGHRSSPVCAIVFNDGQLTAAVPEFWQQFPAALGAADGCLVAEFFPVGEQVFELQGGEQKTHNVWISTQQGRGLDHLNWVYEPVHATQPPQWIRQSGVFSWLPDLTSTDSAAKQYLNYTAEATTGDQSLNARRERADEYGWRNFGDVHADHEQAHYSGHNTLASHYNNQFDLILGGILNMAATGDPGWEQMFGPLARHVCDIDLYHTNEDRACFNGGLFWHTDHNADAHTATHRTYSAHNRKSGESYGGGPSCEHNYTTGLLYYHFLTGSQEARDAVISLANWVIGMDDGSRTIWSAFDNGPTGLATQTVFENYHGPGRGAGNSINALLDGWLLTGQQHYLDKAEELIRRVTHPRHNCDSLHLIDSEDHWSYTVCMLALGRYVEAKHEAGQKDFMYAWARESLDNYGQWMADHERPALSNPEKLEYPTVAWAAQEFRKANVLRIAASCCDNPETAERMRSKANELNEAAWSDLYRFGRDHLTARCLSLVMTEGLRDVFHRTTTYTTLPPADESHEWPDWGMFVPQKVRVKKMLRNPVKGMLAVCRLFNPFTIRRTFNAVRRQM